VEGSGVLLPPVGEEMRRLLLSILERLLSDRSSGPGLRGRLRVADCIEGDTWLLVEETELRWGAGRGEGLLCRLLDGEWAGSTAGIPGAR
jgi:hypothetical protein